MGEYRTDHTEHFLKKTKKKRVSDLMKIGRCMKSIFKIVAKIDEEKVHRQGQKKRNLGRIQRTDHAEYFLILL